MKQHKLTIRLAELPYQAAKGKLGRERLTWQQLVTLLINAWLVGEIEVDPNLDPRLLSRDKSLETAVELSRRGEKIVRRSGERQW